MTVTEAGPAHAAARRIMFVHAHPDDESIATGATMAHYVAAGAQVTLVTCTLGEEGEIHVPALSQLAADRADQLGGYRIGELTAACAALGVTDHRFLGGAGRYRDSGMMDTPANQHPRAFWSADLDSAAGHLLDIVREVRPQVLVSDDTVGFYGHPDHIQSHRVTARAAELATKEGYGPAKIYWHTTPRRVLVEGFAAFADSEFNPFQGVERAEDLPFGATDEEISARIDGHEHAEAKLAALQAHRTQIPPTSWLYAIAANYGQEFMGVEYFTLAHGERGPGTGPHSWESDLFAGLDTD